MTINAQNRLLPDWFARVRTRQTVLPQFQRFEAWGHANVIHEKMLKLCQAGMS